MLFSRTLILKRYSSLSSNFINKLFIFFLVFSLLILSGCAGTGANPIRVIQINDENLTCDEIEKEVNYLFSVGNFKQKKRERTDSVNLVTWIAGQLFLFPMLAMDVKGSAEIERKAILRRVERLQSFAKIKKC